MYLDQSLQQPLLTEIKPDQSSQQPATAIKLVTLADTISKSTGKYDISYSVSISMHPCT